MAETASRDRSPFDDWCDSHLQTVATLPRGSRSAGEPAPLPAAEFAEADLMSVHFADGSVLHTRPAQWLELLAARGELPSAAVSRGPAGTAPGIVLPFELHRQTELTRAGGAGSGVPIERYTFARLTEPTSLDRVYKAGAWLANVVDAWLGGSPDPAAGAMAVRLCRAFEDSAMHPAVGDRDGLLLHWRDGAWQPFGGAPLKADRPVVLFLHGTASSTDGSFGALHGRARETDPLPADFKALVNANHLLAWEHRSLTRSPIENVTGLARALAGAMSPGQRVHLVSQSRGGMLGDLLCVGLQPAAAQQVYHELLERCFAGHHPDKARVPELCEALRGLAALQAGTFVRVASPSRGTLLADGRTDLYLSLLLRSLGLALGANGHPVYERLNALVRGLVASRADAARLPGLEAMIPGSPLTLALNAVGDGGLAPLPGALRVIAGDCAATGLGGLLTLAADVFYGLHDHDMVVHTHSMFGGFPRNDPKSVRLEDKSVNHLAYFKPEALSRGPLFAALAGQDNAFRALADDERATRGLLQALKSDPWCRRPRSYWDAERAEPGRSGQAIVVLLPGIMGSELYELSDRPLAARSGAVWLSLGAMASGRMAGLELRADAHGVALDAAALMPVAYERLLDAARRRYRVVPWPYDWRQPIEASATRLRALLEALSKAHPRTPIHLLAHSMGGLVARHALWGEERDPGMWDDLKRCGSRLLMLGTPNAGSYAPVQLLAQQHGLSHLLATVAVGVAPQDMARWGGRYPGLMQMLPAEPDPQYGTLFDEATWAALHAADPLVQPPDREVLAAARKFVEWRTERAKALREEAHALYVAGIGSTPTALRAPAMANWTVGEGQAAPLRSGLRFALEVRGDGVVSWTSCPAPERTWFIDCEHGDLADQTGAFEAFFELLDTGRTKRLTQIAPQAAATSRGGEAPPDAGGAGRAASAAPGVLPFLPADFGAYVLGMQRTARRTSATLPITVRVVHGGLDYARFPLVVGHYQDDSILGGTKRVDEKLDGQLTRMVELKLFTGVERTAIYLRPPTEDLLPPPYPGAIVVGLGSVGELTPASLSASVTRAVLRYAFDHMHRDPWVPPEGELLLRLSSLLVGTHVQAISPRDSLAAVLGGIWRASLHLQQGGAGRPMRVAEVELIEIQEQAALDAAYELQRLCQREEWVPRLAWPAGTLEGRSGGIRGYRPSHVDTVWQRLVVRQQKLGGLKFELIAERARVEATQVQADVASLNAFIQHLSDNGVRGGSGADAAELGAVLFQLLLPQSLKGRLQNMDNTVLVVDQESAAYPWELMVPPDEDQLMSDGPRPLALQAGLVRQRVADEFRALPTLAPDWRALVVGAPDTAGWTDDRGNELKFGSLPGALDEAHQVRQWLEQDHRAWEVTALLDKAAPFQRVRMALLARPYRLLHLCGHGVVNAWVGKTEDPSQPQVLRKTGLALNDQQVLTAADVEQMGSVPEFVFINCCYSGQDGDAGRLAPLQRELPLLASSLALQFIRMGSRAVVAAGWQVDDQDALTFARSLYHALLAENRSFGDAVLDARRAVQAAGRGGNTWGAYQCYGDPAWRLVDHSARRGYAEQFGSSRLASAAQAMSRSELADRVLQVVALAGDKPRAALLMQLEDLIRALQDDPRRCDWLQHSELRSAFGKAFRELGEHEQAVQWLQAGTRRAYSRVTLRDVEFMVNSLSRMGTTESQKLAEKILSKLDAIDHADMLHQPALEDRSDRPSGAQSERDCLRGSNGLHRATASRGPAGRAAHYLRACHDFATGYAGKLEPRDSAERRAYALSSCMLSAGLALVCGAPLPQVQLQIEPLRDQHHDHEAWEWHCQSVLDEIEGLGLSTSFWHYTNSLELITARTLLRLGICLSLARRAAAGDKLIKNEADWLKAENSQLPQLLADVAQAQRLLRHALVRWPSPVEAESIRDRFAAVARSCAEAQAVPQGFGERLDALRRHAEQAVKLIATAKTWAG